MATSENIGLLFELFNYVDCEFRIKIMKFIHSLLECGVSLEILDLACKDKLLESDSVLVQSLDKPFEKFIILEAIGIREGTVFVGQKYAFDLSKYLLKLLLNTEKGGVLASQASSLKVLISQAVPKLTKMNQGELSVFFELLGASNLETFCLEDEVKFHDKSNQLYTSQGKSSSGQSNMIIRASEEDRSMH